jgi:hypothetical protein
MEERLFFLLNTYTFQLFHSKPNGYIFCRFMYTVQYLISIFISWLSQVCGVYSMRNNSKNCLFFVRWLRMFTFLFFLYYVEYTSILLQSMAVVFSCLLRCMSCCLFSYATRHGLSSFSLFLHGKLICPLFLSATRHTVSCRFSLFFSL